MMRFTTPAARYIVKSHGNGWAYEVIDPTTGDSLWFQDDNAAQLREDTQDFTDNGAMAQYFDCLCE